MKICTICQCRTFEKLNDCLTCTNCGNIVTSQQSNFVHDNDKDYSVPTTSIYKPKTTYIASDVHSIETYIKDIPEIKKKKLYDLIQHMTSIVTVSQPYIDRIKLISLQVMGDKLQIGKKGHLIIAAVIYLVCRENNRPVTLLDLSDYFQIDVFRLGRMFNEIKQRINPNLKDIDPVLFIERSISDLLEDDKVPEEERFRLSHKAHKLVRFANDSWLGTGRHPNTIIGGALYITLLSEDKYKMYAKTNCIASTVSITATTLRKRVKEIYQRLLEESKNLPWGQSITKKNISFHVDAILKYASFTSSNQEADAKPEKKETTATLPTIKSSTKKMDHALPTVKSSTKKRTLKQTEAPEPQCDVQPSTPPTQTTKRRKLPPSFVELLKKKEEMQFRINSAKHRLKMLGGLASKHISNEAWKVFLEFNVDKCCGQQKCVVPIHDETDFMIQRLLLDGIPESIILDGNIDKLYAHSTEKLASLGLNQEEDEMFIRSDDEVKLLKTLEDKESSSNATFEAAK